MLKATTSSPLVQLSNCTGSASTFFLPCLSGTIDNLSGDLTVSGAVFLDASAAYTQSGSFTYSAEGTGGTFQLQTIGVVTSQQAARTVNAAYFQGNAGNDSIAFGDSLTKVSAATFAGGAGNDIIGGFTNVNNAWTAVTMSALFVNTNIEGGGGNDTIQLNGNAVYSALNVNANKGDDLLAMRSTVSGVSKSTWDWVLVTTRLAVIPSFFRQQLPVVRVTTLLTLLLQQQITW